MTNLKLVFRVVTNQGALSMPLFSSSPRRHLVTAQSVGAAMPSLNRSKLITKRSKKRNTSLLFCLFLVGALFSSVQAATFISLDPSTAGCGNTNLTVPNDQDALNCPAAGTFSRTHGNWNDGDCWSGGSSPGQTIGSGDIVIINHHMYYDNSSDLTNNGLLQVVGGVVGAEARPSLHIPSLPSGRSITNTGTFHIFNAQYDNWRRSNGCGTQSGGTGSGSVSNEGGLVYVLGSRIETAQDWVTTSEPGGNRIHQDSCIFTGQNYGNDGGSDQLIGVCADLSNHNSGSFNFNSGSTFFDDFELYISGTSGNMNLKGTLSGTLGTAGGGIQYVEGPDKIVEDASGSVDLEQYCVNNGLDDKGNLTGTLSSNCTSVPEPFFCSGCSGGAPSLSAVSFGSCSVADTITLGGTASGGFVPGSDPNVWDLVYTWSSSPVVTITDTDTSDAEATVNTVGLADGTYTFTLTVTDLVGSIVMSPVDVEISGGGLCSTTAVTIGEVDVVVVSVDEFFASLEVDNLSNAELLALLRGWNSDIPSGVLNRSRIDAILRKFLDSDSDGLVTLLVWTTLFQHGTIGFYVERQDESGNWNKINNRLLPSMLSPLGGEYLLVDPTAVVGSNYLYRIVELEAKGGMKTYGPYSLSPEKMSN